MSTTEERETELITGVIDSVIAKGPDKWQVVVKPDGSQYTKNLWTKDQAAVDAAMGKIGQHAAFPCSVSHWTNADGKPVRSLWLESMDTTSEGAREQVPIVADSGEIRTVPGRPVVSGPSSEGMTPEKWNAKERRDYRSRAWAQTLATFQHTIKVDEEPEAVFLRLMPFQRSVYEDVCGAFAYPADDSDVPFS